VRVAAALLASGTALAVSASFAAVLLLSRYGGLEAIWLTQPGSELTVLETQQLLTIGGDGTTPADTWWWLAVDRPRTGTPPDLIGTAGTVLALLGMLLLAAQVTLPVARGLIAAVLAPLAAAGSMTLTFYTLHILFINSDHNDFDPALSFLLQVVGVLLVGLGWRATAGRGPMEAMLAALANQARRFARRRSPPEPVDRRF
jgi:hypothetical protein